MKYFKDAADAVYAFEADGSQDAYISERLTPISEEEADALRAPSQPPTLVPMSVSRFQARAALHQSGHFEAVEEIMGRPETPTIAKFAWRDATTFDRDSSTVEMLSSALGLSDSEVDDLFALAASITA